MADGDSRPAATHLTLGWEVTEGLEARYWSAAGARPGGQAVEDLFRVPTVEMAHHTAIIAQSGSGKSFFLGRLIEELLINSKARCVVLDPNADFRRIAEVVEDPRKTPWTEAGWGQGLYTHEPSREPFQAAWDRVGKCVRSGWARVAEPGARPPRQVPLELWWPSIPGRLLTQDLEPVQRSEFTYCHKTMELLGFLLEYKSMREPGNCHILAEGEHLFGLARSAPGDQLKEHIESRYGFLGITGRPYDDRSDGLMTFESNPSLAIVSSSLKAKAEALARRAAGIAKWVSPEVERLYFAKASEYQSLGVLQEVARSPEARWSGDRRLEVIDLPSLDESIRTEVVLATLDREWSRARAAWETAMLPLGSRNKDRRVPTYVVVDEAHNLLPATPKGRTQEALNDMFRRITAEGRKFGLFLIFVSQRPDKLDPQIFSECENQAVMKVGSKRVLHTIREAMSFDDVDRTLLEKCRDFKTGRALMCGKWATGSPRIIYGAARRTVAGGGNLDSEFWAIP